MNSTMMLLQFLVWTTIAGVIATLTMTLFMNLITRSGLTNADMVRAIGSVLTRSEQAALPAGLLVHLLSGIAFAMMYTVFFNALQLQGWFETAGVGMSVGFVHGFVLSFLLVTAVAEHHPVQKFRRAGMGVAVSHLFGHMVYGLILGMVIGLSGFRSWVSADEWRAQYGDCPVDTEHQVHYVVPSSEQLVRM